MESKLRECPFCGKHPIETPLLNSYVIGCSRNCPVAPAVKMGTREQCVERWNTRHTSPLEAALIKARDALQSLGGDTADIQARDEALSHINSVLGE